MMLDLAVHVAHLTAPPIPTRWRKLAACESGGDWRYNDGQSEGGLNMLPATWLAEGGGRYATHAYDATPAEQVTIARRVQRDSGWAAWPACSVKVGLARP